MDTRANILCEINDVLDNEMMTEEQLLGELLQAMSTQELIENWTFIKQNWELDIVSDLDSEIKKNWELDTVG